QRLPAGEPDPRLERPRLPRSLGGRNRPAARPEQLPRVHRPSLPRAMRGAGPARQLHATTTLPEFTGRLCPAPCEAACVLEIREGDAVTIKQIENAIINHAWDAGWVVPVPPRRETGRSVAVVGAGPAGMAAAQQLRRAGPPAPLYEPD